MLVIAMLEKALSEPSYYGFSRLVPMQDATEMMMSVSRVECALKCFSQSCLRFVHSKEVCTLHYDWQLKGPRGDEKSTVVEYKMKDVCPERFFYVLYNKQCFFTDMRSASTWESAFYYCLNLHPEANLATVETLYKNKFLLHFLYQNGHVLYENYYWTAGTIRIEHGEEIVRKTSWWNVDSGGIPFGKEEVWHQDFPILDDSFNCIAISNMGHGLMNFACRNRYFFICQVDAKV